MKKVLDKYYQEIRNWKYVDTKITDDIAIKAAVDIRATVAEHDKTRTQTPKVIVLN